MLFITEIFCHCQTSLSHTHTRSRRLIHLTEYQSSLLQNTGLFHFRPEVISLTGTLSDSGKNRVSTVLCRNVSDQFLDQHRLTDSCTTEQSDLTALCIWCKKVNDLDSRLQDLYYRALIFKCRRFSVDHPFFCILDLFSIINCFT